MKHIVCIGGYPGSGKTHLARWYEKQGYRLIDDPSVNHPPAEVADIIRDNERIVVCDPWFVSGRLRVQFLLSFKETIPNADIEWFLFENDPVKCKVNLTYRAITEGCKRSINSLTAFERVYDAMPNTLPIWQPEDEA